MKFRILNSKEKKEFEEKNNFKVNGILLEMGDVLRIYTGNLSREELLKMFREVNVIRIGLSFSQSKLCMNPS